MFCHNRCRLFDTGQDRWYHCQDRTHTPVERKEKLIVFENYVICEIQHVGIFYGFSYFGQNFKPRFCGESGKYRFSTLWKDSSPIRIKKMK